LGFHKEPLPATSHSRGVRCLPRIGRPFRCRSSRLRPNPERTHGVSGNVRNW